MQFPKKRIILVSSRNHSDFYWFLSLTQTQREVEKYNHPKKDEEYDRSVTAFRGCESIVLFASPLEKGGLRGGYKYMSLILFRYY